MGLRERKRERTRTQIVDAAFELFAEHGFTDTTVKMIADEAFVSPRTIYRHFSSKDAIVFSELDGEIDRIATRARDHCAEGATMGRLVAAFAEQFSEGQEEGWFLTLVSLTRESPELMSQAEALRRELAARLAHEIAGSRGAGTPDVGDRAMAAAAVAIAAVSLTEWSGTSPRGDASEIMRHASEIVVDNWDHPNR